MRLVVVGCTHIRRPLGTTIHEKVVQGSDGGACREVGEGGMGDHPTTRSFIGHGTSLASVTVGNDGAHAGPSPASITTAG